MPQLIDYNGKNEKWIYDAFEEGNMIYDSEKSLYKYFNKKYPNRKYTKTFDPKSFMSRGDVICFGGNYRNERKMIFDGQKLEYLYTKVDDYGSVPPTYLVGDNDNEFNIGDFEESIDHNSINWLSKDKLKEIEISENNYIIEGSLQIKGKTWKIYFDIYENFEFSIGASRCFSDLKCTFENDEIFLHKNNTYLITSSNQKDDELKKFIKENNESIHMFYNNESWYILKYMNEYKLLNDHTPLFPCLIKNVYTDKHYFQSFVIDKKQYDLFIQGKDIDYKFIQEIECYPITIELIKKTNSERKNHIKNFINDAIDNFDNEDKRIPVNRNGHESFEIYLPSKLL
jgi:hypothetical protein